MSKKTVIPYSELEINKKKQVALMFNKIAKKYDFLNHFLSMGIDILWRRKAIKILKKETPETILDIATGTGDFAIEAVKLNPSKIIGVDISDGMLKVGKQKIINKKLNNIIELQKGDSENLQFDNESFDAITAAFGVRNFENLHKGLKEMYRVLNQNGTAVILEFSKPSKFPIKQLYNFYFSYILPFFGKFFSKDNSAYTYLPESVKAFPDGALFINELEKAGFTKNYFKILSFGIATIYVAKK